jgi:hypothetical protein
MFPKNLYKYTNILTTMGLEKEFKITYGLTDEMIL